MYRSAVLQLEGHTVGAGPGRVRGPERFRSGAPERGSGAGLRTVREWVRSGFVASPWRVCGVRSGSVTGIYVAGPWRVPDRLFFVWI